MQLVLEPQPDQQDLQEQGVNQSCRDDERAASAQLGLTGGLRADSMIAGADPLSQP